MASWTTTATSTTAYNRRRGFTALEMLIVLAVLAATAALMWPAMHRLLRKSAVEGAAGQVRAELAKTRLEAIQSGVPWQFRFQPGTGRYEATPRAPGTAAGGRPLGDSVDAYGRPLVTGTVSTAGGDALEGELSAGVYFWISQMGETPAPPSDDGLTDYQQPWSAPIVFYPNGRTLNAHFQVSDFREYHVEVTLRGLTGAAAIGEVLRRAPEGSL